VVEVGAEPPVIPECPTDATFPKAMQKILDDQPQSLHVDLLHDVTRAATTS